MGLDQLRRSIELKERVNLTRIDSHGKNSGVLKQPGKKPLMERYRRQKINNYLEELKYLVLSALNKEVSLYNKMEKADILDMAVKYIKAVRPTTPEASTTDYRQRYEHGTAMTPGYQMDRVSPLAVQSSNIKYDNLYRSSHRGPKTDMKENYSIITKRDQPVAGCWTEVSTRTLNAMQNPQRQNHSQLDQSLRTETENCNPALPRAIPTQIWRPW